jgi:hypothetical protein
MSKSGFVNHFEYRYRNTGYQFRYSAKENMIYWIHGYDYITRRDHHISATLEEKIYKIMQALYKEEE